MNDTPKPVQNIARTAVRWADSSHERRQRAVEDTLSAPNRWTEQALDHGLNRWMQRLTLDALDRWLGEADSGTPSDLTIGVIHGEEEPFDGFRDAIAAWGLGFDYVGVVPESSPVLIPAFAEEAFDDHTEQRIEFGSKSRVLETADIVIASQDSTEGAIREACEEHGISSSRSLIRSPVYSVGVIDGHESEDEMERLAEDMLLYEGKGRRRLAVLWAPRDHAPDAYLEAMARFRGLFPAHEDTPGTLQMQQAFLEARDEPHAYADGLEFLVSRGDPSPQRPGHVRWSEYDDRDEVADWMTSHGDDVYAVIARRHLHDQFPESWSIRTPGGVHIPPLDDEEGQRTVRFLNNLDAES